jgi:hypothetical protein
MPEDIASRCPPRPSRTSSDGVECQLDEAIPVSFPVPQGLQSSSWDGHGPISSLSSLFSVSGSVSPSTSERIARCFPLETREMDSVGLRVVSVVSNEVPTLCSPRGACAERGENSNEVVDTGDAPLVLNDGGDDDDDSIRDEFEFRPSQSCSPRLTLWGDSVNTESNRPGGVRCGGLLEGIGGSGAALLIGRGGGDGVRLA